ncbi:hypothetical protein VTO42DRAFT_4837 [Malbranchea cinnamomea]
MMSTVHPLSRESQRSCSCGRRGKAESSRFDESPDQDEETQGVDRAEAGTTSGLAACWGTRALDQDRIALVASVSSRSRTVGQTLTIDAAVNGIPEKHGPGPSRRCTLAARRGSSKLAVSRGWLGNGMGEEVWTTGGGADRLLFLW